AFRRPYRHRRSPSPSGHGIHAHQHPGPCCTNRMAARNRYQSTRWCGGPGLLFLPTDAILRRHLCRGASAAHTYYAQVENSVVKTVNAKFFDKYLPLESARSQWLKEVGLLDAYKESRMETFFTGWYLRKLKDVPENQFFQAVATVRKLGEMYGTYEWQTNEAQAFWAQSSNTRGAVSSDEARPPTPTSEDHGH